MIKQALPLPKTALQHPIFKPYHLLFRELLSLDFYPSIDQINLCYQNMLQHQHQSKLKALQAFDFVNQALLKDELAYEERIFKHQQIPTRLNHAHDLFGAMIWALFPKTKYLFNQYHMAEIQQYGLKHRSRLRDQLTLFDESGAIVFYRDQTLIQSLLNYDWLTFFFHQREAWLKGDLQIVVFGHAILEQFLSPHPNITAKIITFPIHDQAACPSIAPQYSIKALASEAQADLSPTLSMNILDLDLQLSQFFQHPQHLTQKFHPLPMIGIPQYTHSQTEAFYLNPHCFKKPNQLKNQINHTSK